MSSHINGLLLCSHYQLAVVVLPDSSIPTTSPDELFTGPSSFLTPSQALETKSRVVAYIAAEFTDDEFPAAGQFLIGQPNQVSSRTVYENNTVLPKGNYTFFLRAFPVNCNVSP